MKSQKRETVKFNESLHGTYVIFVPCNVEIINIDKNGKSELIIPTGTPCVQDIHAEFTVTRILPFSWINLTSTNVTTFAEYQKTNITITKFNPNWNISHLISNDIEPMENFTKRLKNLEIKIPDLEYQETFSLVHLILIIWLTLLTLILAITLYCTYVQKPQILPTNIGELSTRGMELLAKNLNTTTQEREIK